MREKVAGEASNRVRRPKMSLRGRARRLGTRLAIWTIVLGVAGLLLWWAAGNIEALARTSPTTWAVYEHVRSQAEGHTYLGLFYISFLGALFFVFVPLEVVFFYYLSLPRFGPFVVAVSWLGSVLGLCADYLIGTALGKGILARFWPERMVRTKRSMERWGPYVIVVSNVVPFLPVQFVSLAVGSTRFGLKGFFRLTLLSRLVYLAGLWAAAEFFGPSVTKLLT